MSNDITEYRIKIDEIDTQILELLTQRIEIVKQVGEYKKIHKLPPLDPIRWEEILLRLKSRCEELDINYQLIADLWNRIHEYTVELEKEMQK